jgi:hypothetical protein
VAGGGVQVEGLSRKVRDLQRLGLEVDDLKDAFSSIASEGAERVESYTPVGETGNLASTVRGNRAKSKAVVRAGNAATPYAGPINYGWPSRGIEAAEYMQKGDQEMQPIAVQRLEQEIEHQIRRRGLQ